MATAKDLFHTVAFDPETIRAMCLAYDQFTAEIGLTDGTKSLNLVVAQQIIKAAKSGEIDPDKLRATAMDWFIGMR